MVSSCSAAFLWLDATSLDRLVAGPNPSMGRPPSVSSRPGTNEQHMTTTGADLAGWDGAIDAGWQYGGTEGRPTFVLSHDSENATPSDAVTFLSQDRAEAVRIAPDAAGGKNLEVFSPTIGGQLLQPGRHDEIDLHMVPNQRGDGIRPHENPDGPTVRLDRLGADDPAVAVNLWHRPSMTTAAVRRPSQRIGAPILMEGDE